MIGKMIEGVFNLTKIPAKFMAVFCIISGVLLFAPANFIEILKLSNFKELYGDYLGIVFLISGGFTSVAVITSFIRWIKRMIRSWNIKSEVRKNLNMLTLHEQSALREFFIQRKDVIEMPIHDPVIISLQNKFIITQVSSSGKVQFGDAYFSYKIVDFARKNLTPEMIKWIKDDSKLSIEWLINNRPYWAIELEKWDNIRNSLW